MRSEEAVLADFLFLEDAEGFRGVVGALQVGGVEDVAQFVATEAVGAGIEGVEISAQNSTAILIPGERADRHNPDRGRREPKRGRYR